MSRTSMTTLPFLFLAVSPFVIFESDNPLISCPLCNTFGIFYDTWQKCRTGPNDVSRTKMTTLPFLPLALSPFVISPSNYPLILPTLCKSKTFWNIFMIFGRNIEQEQTTCHV